MSAVAGLVVALETIESENGPSRWGQTHHADCSHPGCVAARALAAWRARPPLREDPKLVHVALSFAAGALNAKRVGSREVDGVLDLIDREVLGLAAQPVPGEPVVGSKP